MEENKYHIIIDKKNVGPYSVEELISLGLNKYSLVWNESFENWIEADKVEELKLVLTKIPPPIPNQKKHSNLKDRVEIGFAKEIKFIVRTVLYCVLISVLIYVVSFFLNDGFAHAQLINKWENHTMSYPWTQKEIDLYNESHMVGCDFSNMLDSKYNVINCHEGKLRSAKTKSYKTTVFLFWILLLSVLSFKYLKIFIAWINKKSKMNI